MSAPALDAVPFDRHRLTDYLRTNLPGFSGEVAFSRFQGGQSNPTFRLDTPAASYVLRKKPSGHLIPGAHAVEREYRLMAALAGLVPVPRMLLLCEDPEVIGQSFYLMEHVAGRIFRDARMLDAPKPERHGLCLELAEVLGRLHRVDHRAAGLADFGKAEGYVARQLARWSKQYAQSRFEDNTAMDRLVPWLEANAPDDHRVAIVHGDYRTHNVIYASSAPRIAAVLDWELATIGHPVADLAYCLLPYHMPPDDPRGFGTETAEALAIPSEAEMLAAYCRTAGKPEIPNWRFFLVFALFRSAAIRAGVYRRVLDGTAVNPAALAMGELYRSTADCAWRLTHGNPANG